jgi:protein SCO1/2/putative membrane protein
LDASYRIGLSIVFAAFALALGVALTPGMRRAPEGTVAEDLGARPHPLGAFRFTERSGRTVTDADLADRVWIASFIFTRCPSSCPRISAVMKGFQARMAREGIQLVSLSVDPDHDTPEVLAKYARGLGSDPDHWWFLTAPKDEIYRFIRERFKLGVEGTTAEDQAAGAESVAHSSKLALVDRGNRVVGYFDSTDPPAVRRLLRQAEHLRPTILGRLPTLNAALNASCAACILIGWRLIRARRIAAHATCMVIGVMLSVAFLASYLYYHWHVLSVPFRGAGPIRVVYFTVLLSHTVLAVAVVPLVIQTLRHAIHRRWVQHLRIARITFPIWLYVSITGVLVYLMLYQMPLPQSS